MSETSVIAYMSGNAPAEVDATHPLPVTNTSLPSQTGRAVASSTATIANGQTTSGVIDTSAKVLAGIQTPATLTSITAISFQVSSDGVTYVDLYDETSTKFSINPIAVSRAYSIPPYLTAPWAYVKLVGNAAAGADRVFGLSLIPV